MTINMKSIVKRVVSSICLSFAILAIANVDTLVSEKGHSENFAQERAKEAKARLRQQLEVVQEKPEHKTNKSNQAQKLSDSLAQDEFGDFIPFAHLSTLDPLTKVIQKGVARYDRTVYRSPDFQGEGGYDLVAYEIQHTDGTHSSILAYLDRPALTVSRNVGLPDSRLPVIMIMEGRGSESAYSLFRAGNLIEQSAIPSEDVNGLVAQRISASIPFLSVAR